MIIYTAAFYQRCEIEFFQPVYNKTIDGEENSAISHVVCLGLRGLRTEIMALVSNFLLVFFFEQLTFSALMVSSKCNAIYGF